jgi:hypothetical protein
LSAISNGGTGLLAGVDHPGGGTTSSARISCAKAGLLLQLMSLALPRVRSLADFPLRSTAPAFLQTQ